MYYGRADDLNMWQSPLAWQVAIFFGLQAFSYNALMTWLPEILIEYGTSSNSAGWMLSFNQLIGLPASLLIPIIAGKFRSQRRDRKSTRLNSSHVAISYAVFCLKKKKKQ